MKREKNIFFTFCETITRLRSPDGCPWDRKQSVTTLKKYIREECDELLEAMDDKDPEHLCEEIGDVFFLLLLLSEISAEAGHFNIVDVIKGIDDKMKGRHPHVFGNIPVGSEKELKTQWEKIKSQERRKKTN
ncbi:MAG: nucleotide pyrophosphohydrolase [Desulfocapsa sp.]|nr:nucleotide pyrophosphohydrolase [Desulfocapsa sp.]